MYGTNMAGQPVSMNVVQHTVFCQIEVPGAIARLNMIPWSKSWGSELSNSGFRLSNIMEIKPILVPQQNIGSPNLRGRLY